MELRHLRYFSAVAEELNFTRAAARLGIGQPPLSQQIQQLEREIGTPLFYRPPRGVSLTEAGKRFLRDAQEILSLSDRALENARRASRGETGTLRVGFTSSAAFHPFVSAIIRDFGIAYPDVGINLIEDTTTQLLQALNSSRLDAAFMRPTSGEARSLECHLLFKEPMLVALPSGHRCAAQSRIPLSALCDETFVLYPRRNGRALHDAIIQACEQAGFQPRIAQEGPQMATTINLVAAGVGVSIVPASMSQIQARGVHFREIAGPGPRAALSLVSLQSDAASPLRNFVDLVLRHVRDGQIARD